MDPEVGTEGPRRLFPDFETQWNLPGWNSTFWGTSDSFSFSFPPFLNQNIYASLTFCGGSGGS